MVIAPARIGQASLQKGELGCGSLNATDPATALGDIK
jgi:hypothetical protein